MGGLLSKGHLFVCTTPSTLVYSLMEPYLRRHHTADAVNQLNYMPKYIKRKSERVIKEEYLLMIYFAAKKISKVVNSKIKIVELLSGHLTHVIRPCLAKSWKMFPYPLWIYFSARISVLSNLMTLLKSWAFLRILHFFCVFYLIFMRM